MSFLRLLPIVPVCLLPGLLFAAAKAPSQPVVTATADAPSYTVQAGDTLVGIARKHGLSPDELVKANALERPDRIMVGNVLRLPVTPPTAPAPGGQTKPLAAPAAATAPQPFPEPPAAASPNKAEPATAKPETAENKAKVPQAPAAPVAAKPGPKAVSKAEASEPSAPPAAGPVRVSDPADATIKLAVGTYTNPVLGALRISQTPTGIAVSRDNQTISMRHLLYGVFDGTDNAGGVHGLRLEYDASGQVSSLQYSSSSGKDISFTRVRK